MLFPERHKRIRWTCSSLPPFEIDLSPTMGCSDFDKGKHGYACKRNRSGNTLVH